VFGGRRQKEVEELEKVEEVKELEDENWAVHRGIGDVECACGRKRTSKAAGARRICPHLCMAG
jgi:hypothetical protein